VNRRWPLFAALALGGACLDVALKAWAFSRFTPGSITKVVPGVFWIQLATNRGVAWGLFPSRVWVAVSLAAIPLVAFYFLRVRKARLGETLCGASILAGTIGNTWDRTALGYVRDFLCLPAIPNFNLADAMLTCGIAALLLLGFLHDRRPVDPPGPPPARQPDDGGVGDVGRDHGPSP
jgi:lipoprotein signal peptidase